MPNLGMIVPNLGMQKVLDTYAYTYYIGCVGVVSGAKTAYAGTLLDVFVSPDLLAY